jgi:cell division protein YceG involved in septum cleavage
MGWALTPREFWIIFAGFMRRENRAKAEAIRQALRTGSYKKSDRQRMEQAANALTQYPIKAWTLPEGMTVADMQAVLTRRSTLRTEDDGAV